MGVTTQRYIRKPLYVDAVRVTAQNFDEIVAWCQGEVQTDEQPGSGTTKKFIKVRVHNPKNPRQTKAFIGDWLLYTERGYKVYTNKAFRAAFDIVEVEPEELHSPSPTAPHTTPKEEAERAATAEEIRAGLPNAQDKRSLYKPKDEGGLAEPHGASTGADPEFEGVSEFADEDREIAEANLGAAAAVDPHHTPQGEPHEYVEATPRAIAEAVSGNQPIEPPEYPEETTIGGTPREEINVSEVAPQPEAISEQPPEVADAGKRVLSEEEQRRMGPDQVRELVQSGEVVLAQDLAA